LKRYHAVEEVSPQRAQRKAVEEIKGIHKVQLLTYMKLSGFDAGLLINFNVERLTDGIEAPRSKLRGISDCQGKCLFLFARYPHRKQRVRRSLFNSKV